MEQGAAYARIGPGPKDYRVISPQEQRQVGYDKSWDTPWEEIVTRQPGATWGERLRNAIQLTLEGYDYDKDQVLRELRENGDKGVIRFAADGTPIGGKALAGALRAIQKHPRMYRMWTQEEIEEERAQAMRYHRAHPHSERLAGEKRRRRASTITAGGSISITAERQEQRRAQERELLERTTGETDLRRKPTAGKARAAEERARAQARRESYARAVREAKRARVAAEKAARQAAKGTPA